MVAVSRQYMQAKEEVIRLPRSALEARERRLSAQYEISRSLAAAAPQILQTIAESSGWESGTLWERDRDAGVLRGTQRWRAPGLELGEFECSSRSETRSANSSSAIRELSTPVVQVRSRLLIVPLVGAIEEQRARQIKDELLRAIRAHRGRVVVIDLTGVPIIDSMVAITLSRRSRRRGCWAQKVIVPGISRGIAQTLVDIGFELAAIHTAGDLQGGSEEAERSILASDLWLLTCGF